MYGECRCPSKCVRDLQQSVCVQGFLASSMANCLHNLLSVICVLDLVFQAVFRVPFSCYTKLKQTFVLQEKSPWMLSCGILNHEQDLYSVKRNNLRPENNLVYYRMGTLDKS